MLRRLLLAIILLFAAQTASAQIAPELFHDLHWRLVGPFRAGRVLAVVGVPQEPNHFYFGSVNGGVWETNDAGRTWNPIFDSQPVGSIGAIAVAPSATKTIYVGTGEADMRSDIAQGNGMYKSTDGGKNWSRIGLEDSRQIARIIVHPSNPDLLYVAALGHPYAANAERGVYRSRDGGKTWQKLLGDENVGAIDVDFQPGNPDVIYAALWQTRRTPWSVYPPSNGAGSGLFKSTDGGDHWTKISGGFPAQPGRIGIGVAPSDPNRIYSVVDSADGGLYRSNDAGKTWSRASSDNRIWGRGWYFGRVTVNPRNADDVSLPNVNLYESTDGGKTFAPIKGAPGGDDYHELWIDPANAERRLLGVDQGAVVTLNGGKTWSSWFNQPTGQFYHVITDNRFPYWIYGAQQDSGAAGIPSRTSMLDGITIREFKESTPGGESDNIAPDPDDPDILYGGRVDKLDTRTHQSKSIDPTLAYMEHDRRTWTLPLIFSWRDPKVLYFANQHLFRTDDAGDHWSQISPDLTRENPPIPPNLDPVTAALTPESGSRHGVVYTIAPSRVADHDIWVGTDDGLIWRTLDEGKNWQNVTPPAITPWSKIGIIDTSHFDAATAYAAVDRHRLDDVKPYIYRTHDGGKSWQLVIDGIPDDSFVNVVREDSASKGLLYAGTEKGMYVSFDDGDHWQPLQQNLPPTSVRDIDVHQDDLVIATHGRGFWIMDDVTALRQVNDAARAAGAWLYRPALAYRVRPVSGTGMPWPKDEPMAADPPAGAYIDYMLKSAPAQPVSIDILDATGNLIRHYSSADRIPTPDPARLTTAPEWFIAPSAVISTPGMHRFVWPLHYPGGRGQSGRGDGVWALPGTYTVALEVDGVNFTQPLTVAPDPRVKVDPAAYKEEFELARKIEAAHVRLLSATTEEADKFISDVTERQKTATGNLSKDLETAKAKAIAISGLTPADNPLNTSWKYPEDTKSLHYVDAALTKLSRTVDGADGAPTADAKASWALLEPAAPAAIKRWEDFKAADVATLNASLDSAGLAKIPVK